MGDNIRDTKADLRRRVLETVRNLTEQARAAASSTACESMLNQAVWKQARAVLLFAPLPGELDIWPLLETGLAQGKSVALPRFDKQSGHYIACTVQDRQADITLGRWNIREPRDQCALLPLNRLDLVLVPGVAFDLHGRRLGRGKGFYDQILAAVRGLTCGIAFDQQIVREIPVEPHDIQVNRILTPTRWIEL